MFQWYANAVICYAYLSDVDQAPNAPEDEFTSSLASCRWITRGWTLQELIAPPDIVFYSKDWQACGTRSELSAALAAIALIDEPYLNGRPLYHASVAQRMSWASRRTTSRQEDLAYCLLGIFNVNMPLIYGEKLKAFRRLQEAIIREYPEDHSLYAWGKVVSRCSFTIQDKEQIWGSKPIEYDPSLVGRQQFNLFAESPADFKDSGQIVRAPITNGYFDHLDELRSPPFSIGDATQVEFPVMPWTDYAAFHLQCPPIAQIRIISYALLLCGRWSKKRHRFYYVMIPQVVVGAQVSRMDEIVVARKVTPTVSLLKQDTRRYIYKLPRPYMPYVGGLLFRRVIYTVADLDNKIREAVVDAIRLNWLNPPSSIWGMLHAIAFEVDNTRTFAVFIQRTGPVNSGRVDSDDGKLRFGLGVIKTLSDKAQSPDKTDAPIVVENHVSMHEQPEISTGQSTERPPFADINEGLQHFWDKPAEIPHQRDMAVPRDEWRFSLGSYADVFMAVERIWVDDEFDNSDGHASDVEPSYFVDVMDLVIRVKGDPGYEDLEGNEDSGAKSGESAHGENENEGSEDGESEDEKSQSKGNGNDDEAKIN
ncbi:hypothetical protein F4678DRAFT_339846 [Xylaria arbuscula]|nr:hypothetical protein F4678DRAFT_339846 [Xylaria arbuscula]